MPIKYNKINNNQNQGAPVALKIQKLTNISNPANRVIPTMNLFKISNSWSSMFIHPLLKKASNKQYFVKSNKK
jgi:hypothetical protein